jgi:hypothetical protein
MASEAIKAAMIPWERAVLCVACDFITDATGEHCPVCGELGLLNLANCVDGREEKKETVQ